MVFSSVHLTWNDPYAVGTGFIFTMVKWPDRDVDRVTPSSAEVKNEWNYTPAVPLSS
jgi:hypothetical protein